LVFNMNMRRTMVSKIHANVDTEERGDDWH
jgi:hypothetical protein